MKKIRGQIICIIMTVFVLLVGSLSIVLAKETSAIIPADTASLEDNAQYFVKTALNPNMVWDIDGGSMNTGANLQIWTNTNVKQQKYYFLKNQDGSYTIKASHSGQVLDVQDGKLSSGANVWQYGSNGTDAQKWYLEKNENGTYSIRSKLNNLYIDIDGGIAENGRNVQMYSGNGSKAQQFILSKIEPIIGTQTIPDGVYYVKNKQNSSMGLDVDSGSVENGANIQIWKNDKANQQKFKLTYQEGYYTIEAFHSGKVLDVDNAGESNGTNVWQWEANHSDAQKWVIQKEDDGYYSLYAKCNGLCLDIAQGIIQNGSNIQMYTPNGSDAQKFSFEKIEPISSKQCIPDGDYTVRNGINYQVVWDMPKTNHHLELSQKDMTKQTQQFTFTWVNGYYTIKPKGQNQVLTIQNNQMNNGAKIELKEDEGKDNQKWIIQDNQDGYYNLIAKSNELYADLPNGEAKINFPVQLFQGNGTKAQKFILKPVEIHTGSQVISDGEYKILSSVNQNYAVSIKNGEKQDGANTQLESQKVASEQIFHFTYLPDESCYEIEAVHSGKALDVENGSGIDGTNIWQYGKNHTDAQKWYLTDAGNGNYFFTSKVNGLAMDVAGGIAQSGTNIQMYEGNQSLAQQFKLVKTDQLLPEDIYSIRTGDANQYGLDIEGGSLNDGAKLQIWTYVKQKQQQFKLAYLGNGDYTLSVYLTGKALTAEGTKIVQQTYQNSDSQKWKIRYAKDGKFKFLNKETELCITLENNMITNGSSLGLMGESETNKQQFTIEPLELYEEGTYGISGRKVQNRNNGYDLMYYRYGYGPNVLFATYSVHGFEDLWAKDGTELTLIALDFRNQLLQLSDRELAKKWTIYLLPEVNPDGRNLGYTNNGPGRTTLYSQAPGNKGIDLNRCWQVGSSYTRFTDNRNYNGTQGFQAYESSSLRDFLLQKRATQGQTLLVDLHGWTTQVIGDPEICQYYSNQFPENDRSSVGRYGTGYLINWARSSLGYNGIAAKSALIELPSQGINSHEDVVNKRYSERYREATLAMLRGMGR